MHRDAGSTSSLETKNSGLSAYEKGWLSRDVGEKRRKTDIT
jgi:hypothetical protein